MKEEEIIYGEYACGGKYSPTATYSGRVLPRGDYKGLLFNPDSVCLKHKAWTVVELAQKQIDTNKECFIAQWILSNPELNPDDYVLCYQTSYHQQDYRVVDGEIVTSYVKMWMEKKS